MFSKIGERKGAEEDELRRRIGNKITLLLCSNRFAREKRMHYIDNKQ